MNRSLPLISGESYKALKNIGVKLTDISLEEFLSEFIEAIQKEGCSSETRSYLLNVCEGIENMLEASKFFTTTFLSLCDIRF